MSYFIYSSEALPATHLMGKMDSFMAYNPEYIKWDGHQLIVPEKRWTKLPDSFTKVVHESWMDRQGREIETPIRKFRGIIDGQFAARGVIFLDHEPTAIEKEKLEKLSLELNNKFRAKQIEWYESQRQEKMSGNPGRLWPTAYEQECYDLLGVQKPYSVESFKAMREPGGEAAKRIAAAISESQLALVEAVKGAMDRQVEKVPAGTQLPPKSVTSNPQPVGK